MTRISCQRWLPTFIYPICFRLSRHVCRRAECSFSGPLGTFNYITNYVPLLDDAGRIVEVLGISHDNTQQKHFEHELRRRDQELRSLTDNVPDVIGRFDRNLRHVFVNRQIEQVTGLKVEAYLGRRIRDLGLPDDVVHLWDNTSTTSLKRAVRLT